MMSGGSSCAKSAAAASSRSCSSPRRRQRGFSLLEILVAFAIMALSLGILLQIFSSGVTTAVIAEDYIVATQIAESLMARSGVETPLIPGEESGVEDERYRWRVEIAELPPLAGAESSSAAMMEVNVTVEWGDGESGGRSVELNTIKAGPAS